MRLQLCWLSLLCLFLAFQNGAEAFKFLGYMPMLGHSHLNFLTRIAETLVDAGHEVGKRQKVLYDALLIMIHILAPSVRLRHGHPRGHVKDKRIRIIEIEQCDAAREMEAEQEKESSFAINIWLSQGFLSFSKTFGNMRISSLFNAETVGQPGLIDSLRDEKFDVGFTELFELCGFGIFHAAGVKSIAITQSTAQVLTSFELTGAPSAPSYVPGITSWYGERMSFLQRVGNVVQILITYFFAFTFVGPYDAVFQFHYPGMATMPDILAETSLVFINSEPLIDFPRPTTHKIVEIGGITVSGEHKPLNQTWDAIMNARPQTALVSFGSVALSHRMPSEYKETIRNTFRKFPNVTFIWKYEKPEDDIARGIDNIVPVTWTPQKDIL